MTIDFDGTSLRKQHTPPTLAAVVGGAVALAFFLQNVVAWCDSRAPALGSADFGAAVACGVVFGMCAVLVAVRPWDFEVRRVRKSCVGILLVCCLGQLVCWAAILHDDGSGLAAGRVMRDDRAVRAYLPAHMPAGRAPVTVPTGLYVESIEFTQANDVAVSGYVWQRYPADTPKDITKGVVFPEADNSYPEKVVYDRTDAAGTRVIGWYFNANFRQKFNYRSYPLDRQNVWLRMWQPDFDKDAVLVPDFSSYPPWADRRMFGVDSQLFSGEWRPVYTAYSYARYAYPTSFGLKKYARPVSYPDLYFNMVYKRNYTGAIVGNLVPVTLIALVVFASLFVTSRDKKLELFGSNTFAVMAFLVTMLLVVVVDHNEVRKISADGSVIYLEYLYFAVYMLLMLATANGVMIALDRPPEFLTRHQNLAAKAVYWPVLFLILFTATILVFFMSGV